MVLRTLGSVKMGNWAHTRTSETEASRVLVGEEEEKRGNMVICDSAGQEPDIAVVETRCANDTAAENLQSMENRRMGSPGVISVPGLIAVTAC